MESAQYLILEGFLSPDISLTPWRPGSWCWPRWRSYPSGHSTGRKGLLQSRCGWRQKRLRVGTCWEPFQCQSQPDWPWGAQELWESRDARQLLPGQLRCPGWREWLEKRSGKKVKTLIFVVILFNFKIEFKYFFNYCIQQYNTFFYIYIYIYIHTQVHLNKLECHGKVHLFQ